MRMAALIEPELVVESDRVDDERVAFPPPDRMAEPRGIEVGGVLAPVQENLAKAVDVRFIQQVQVRRLPVWRRLHEPPWIAAGHPRYTHRHALRVRVVFRLTRVQELLRPGQERNLAPLQSSLAFEILNGTTTLPHTTKIDASIGQPGN